MQLDFAVAWKYLPFLLQASLMTIAVTVVSQPLGTLAAFFLALARMSPRVAVPTIVEVGTPEEVFGRPRHERTRRFLEKLLV